MAKVLEGIRVLDFGRFIAAPFCGMMLADMGAEVIRIDRPGGEEDRTTGILGPNGENVHYQSYARNKKCITLNLLGNTKGQEVLRDLVKHSDVLLQNFSPGAAEMMGITYENLKAMKPNIIFVAVSCYGTYGPYSKRIGFDPIAQTMSGAAAITGFPGNPPTRSQVPWVDYSTALMATVGTLLALRYRDQTGEGQMVDLALLQTAVTFMAPIIAEYEVLGRNREQVGNRAYYTGPSDLYQCKDGWVYISTIMGGLWRRLLKAIGHEEFTSDPELSNDFQRFEHRDRVDPLVAAWMKQHTVAEVVAAMEEARIPCGRFHTVPEVSQDPHVQARRMIEYLDLEYPGLERVPVCGLPIKMSATPASIERRSPRVGEHNDEVYRGLLKYSKKKIAELQKDGTI